LGEDTVEIREEKSDSSATAGTISTRRLKGILISWRKEGKKGGVEMEKEKDTAQEGGTREKAKRLFTDVTSRKTFQTGKGDQKGGGFVR